MKNPLFETARPISKILFLLFISFSIFIIFLLLGLLVSIPIFGIDFENFSQYFDISKTENITFIKFMQSIQTLGLFAIPPFIAAYIYSKNTFSYLYINTKINARLMLFAAIITVMAIPFISYTANLNSQMHLPDAFSSIENWMQEKEMQAKISTEVFLSVNSISGLLVNIFVVAMLPAIGEELIFRGVLLRLFTDMFKNINVGIIVTAAVFSAIHFQFFGFLPRMIMGIMFGYFLVWTKNILIPIFAHFVNNAFGVIMYYKYSGTSSLDKIENMGTDSSELLMIALITLITLFFIYYFRKLSLDNELI